MHLGIQRREVSGKLSTHTLISAEWICQEKFLGLGTLNFGGIKASKVSLGTQNPLRLLPQVPLQPEVKTGSQILS